MNRTLRVGAVVSSAVLALALAGCGDRDDDKKSSDSPATTAAPKESHPDFKACMVSDSGGFNDKSFNQTAHDGLEAAEENLGVQSGEVESNSDSEYGDNIKQMVDSGCNSITTVGFLLGDATAAAAKANPNVDFSIVDFAYEKPEANVKGLTFATDQPSFLAGYLAAGMSKTGIVGTFGGLPIPTVTIFMDGFYAGVQKYNEDNSKSVKVIGWDPATKKGSFTNDFENKTKGESTGKELITQGADIVFPVAGPAGLGGLQAAKDAGAKAIWVDTDGCVSTDFCDVLLTSVMKAMDVAVESAIRDAANDRFSNELYSGTLENGGVKLAPYHEADVPQELQDKIEELTEQIISGEVKVTP